jgi:hypothetical protein
MTAGRPSKYSDKFIGMVDEYILTTGKEKTSLPTKQGFALYIGVDDDTLDNWANAVDEEGRRIHQEFFGALKKLMLKQAEQLINDGIYGGKEVNSTIVKLLLQNNHGMRDKIEEDHKGEITLALTYGNKSKRTDEPATKAGGSDRDATKP